MLFAAYMILFACCSEDNINREPPIPNDIEWTREFKIPDHTAKFDAIEQTINNEYLIFGKVGFHPFIIKLDDDGERLWMKTYSQYTNSTATDFPILRKVDDLHYAFNHRDGLAVIDTSGSITLEIQKGAVYNFGLTPDKGFILFCGGAETDFVIFDSSGNFIENKTTSYPIFNDVDQGEDFNLYCIYVGTDI